MGSEGLSYHWCKIIGLNRLLKGEIKGEHNVLQMFGRQLRAGMSERFKRSLCWCF